MTDQNPSVSTDLHHSTHSAKFKVARAHLLEALSLVMKASNQHVEAPSLISCVHMRATPRLHPDLSDQVSLFCQNRYLALSHACTAEVIQEGVLAIPVKPLLDCVKTFSPHAEITLTQINDEVEVSAQTRAFTLKGVLSAAPPLPIPTLALASSAPIVLEANVLCQAIKEVQFAVDAEADRECLRGVCMEIDHERLTLIGTDGYRLAVRTVVLPKTTRARKVRLLIPIKVISVLIYVLSHHAGSLVFLTWDRDLTQICFQVNACTFSTFLIAEEFPNYQAVIPQDQDATATFTLSRQTLLQISKAFKPFALDDGYRLFLTYQVSRQTVLCRAESSSLGEASDELPVSNASGSDGEIQFRLDQLAGLLKHLKVDSFDWSITTTKRPGKIIPHGRKDHTFVLMPIPPGMQ